MRDGFWRFMDAFLRVTNLGKLYDTIVRGGQRLAKTKPGRKQREQERRLRPRTLILPGLWLAFVVWTLTDAVDTGQKFFAEPAAPTGGFAPAGLSVGPLGALFAINAWSCAAALLLGLVIVPNPLGLKNGKRMAFGTMALAMMIGRLAGGSFIGLALAEIRIQPDMVLLVTPFALVLSGSAVILALGVLALLLLSVFVAIPAAIFTKIFEFEHALAVYRYRARGLGSYLYRFVQWVTNEHPEPAPDDSKGARFANSAEIGALRQVSDGKIDPAAMAFGHYGDPLFLKTDKHVLIMASTRSGKGVTLIIPHLLRYQGSAFVLDPKGENARATGRRRATLNRDVHYLDPFAISGKPQSRFNPLSRFTPANMEAESKALAAALFLIASGERDHWNASAQQLVATVILYVYVAPSIPASSKDLPTVRTILLASLKPDLEKMRKMNEADGLLASLAYSFLLTPDKELGSIVSTAQRQTEILDNPSIIACLRATGPGQEVDFKAWRRGTMTVYLCLSAPKFPVFNRWLRLVLTSALDEMTDVLDPPKLPVCFMLDELATLGHLETVENAVGLSAGYGIQLVNVFQDTAQMRDLYKNRWPSFIGNAGVRALFNLDDYDTAEYWSKFMGGRLTETRSSQQDVYGYSKGDNVGETMRPLIAPEEIMMVFAGGKSAGTGKMLVLAQASHPLITNRVPYYNDPSLKGLWDDPRTPLIASRPGPAAPALQAARAASISAPPPFQSQIPAGQTTIVRAPTEDVVDTSFDDGDELPPFPMMTEEMFNQIDRNAPCPCGSRRKFKHCHGCP